MALSDNKPTNFKIEDWREWTDANDFPTFESDEATVREDLQYHPDFIKEKFNGMVEALEPYIEERIAEVVVGVLPDGSIQTEMLADESVTAAKLGDDVTPEVIGAADRVHDHDDRYFTKSEFVDRQTRTDLLEEMQADIADADMFPVYDTSEDENLKLSWEEIKAAVKAHIDESFAEDEATYHASRHRPDGADPIHIATGNIDDQAVTHSKLAIIRPYNIYHQTVNITGLEADPEMEHTTIESESDISDITFTVEDGKLKADTLVLRDDLLIVEVTVSSEGAEDIIYTVVFTAAGWTAEPKTDENTAAVRFDNIKNGAVSTTYEATIPAFEDDGSAWTPVDEEEEEESEGEEEEPVLAGYAQTVGVVGLASADEFTVDPEVEGVTFTIDEDDKLTATAEEEPTEDIVITVTQDDTDYHVTFPARKQKPSMAATGSPYALFPEGEDILSTDDVSVSISPRPHDSSSDTCSYEEQCEIFEDCEIMVRKVMDGKVYLTAFKKPSEALWLRLSYPRARSIASVPSAAWARDSEADPWRQSVTVEGMPPWYEDSASHQDGHGVAQINQSTTTSTGNDKAVFDRLTLVEISEGGGGVDLTLDAGSQPGYAFQLTVNTIDYYDLKVLPEEWEGTDAPYVIDIDVTGLLETDRPIIDLLPNDDFAIADLETESYGRIYRMVAGDDKLTIYAIDPIEVDLNIQIKAVRK